MRIQLHSLVAGTPIFFCRASLVLPFSSVLMGAAPARFHFVGQYNVRETNAQPAPATGLVKGFWVLPQQAETACKVAKLLAHDLLQQRLVAIHHIVHHIVA